MHWDCHRSVLTTRVKQEYLCQILPNVLKQPTLLQPFKAKPQCTQTVLQGRN